MINYESLEEELKVNKEGIDKSNNKIKEINQSSKDFKCLLSNLGESKLGGCKLNNQQKKIKRYFKIC